MFLIYFFAIVLLGLAGYLAVRYWRIKRAEVREMRAIAARTVPKIIYSFGENDTTVIARYDEYKDKLEASGNEFGIPVLLCVFQDAEHSFETEAQYLVRLGELARSTQEFSIRLKANNEAAFYRHHAHQNF